MTEWSKAHLTHWQGNRAMTEPWASVYMILCQCARSESNLISTVVCCYLLLSRICALFLCLLSVIWGVLWIFCAVFVMIFVFWCCYVWCCVWWSCYIILIVLLYFLPFDIYYILLFVILFSTEKIRLRELCVWFS